MMKSKIIGLLALLVLIVGAAFGVMYVRRGEVVPRGASTSGVSVVNGVPTLSVNGQPRATTSFCVYNVEGTSPYSSTSLWSDYIH
jgi:uncharacterized membrane protein